eukprot:CAMPEP_0204238252 /NCGR_PEP_ID=MMETSP0361-20130328/93774_1 /ASSEMBLY_ACC=CAM_ASM_000343 /TAXON_ID=268821 /ORGANISM="Scrippsiella Hangoei, Strain SHTV-5" /LENGTH=69 /DNA_ID=CAMNT_0051211021 /DNA_START=351 /DNA_END=560 /DNA_ORIENTATION=+
MYAGIFDAACNSPTSPSSPPHVPQASDALGSHQLAASLKKYGSCNSGGTGLPPLSRVCNSTHSASLALT